MTGDHAPRTYHDVPDPRGRESTDLWDTSRRSDGRPCAVAGPRSCPTAGLRTAERPRSRGFPRPASPPPTPPHPAAPGPYLSPGPRRAARGDASSPTGLAGDFVGHGASERDGWSGWARLGAA